MKIWVDADACPGVIKEILFRAADRAEIAVTLVANHAMRIPPSRFIQLVTVSSGFDVADNEIVRRAAPGDLVITADIPLASEVIDKGALALNPRGELYTEHNIKSILNMRDFMDTMRASGVQTGGPAAIGQSEKQAFGNQLDRLITKYHKR
ncbi:MULTISPECIES: YaiI/YqxD family protein [Shewanella]|uniref:YaiI/YqxD family protein n=1 Tax=Shewanella TaxID=22 RepID=UPI001C657217|nr:MULTISPECIES: YaiI/YqxD family protein [Shewanella]QYJ81402.1 YaiI/YqxD family protein [Shewanella aegiceratis]QYJ91149.1 YaiI/YqxD family protein [Shewanella halotolerans]QYJ92755.1 YaiI/YqxD family protein [Shewanella spartinae]